MKTLEYHHFATPGELMAPGSDHQWLLTVPSRRQSDMLCMLTEGPALLPSSLLPQEPPGNSGAGGTTPTVPGGNQHNPASGKADR